MKHEVEIYIIMDEHGNSGIGSSPETARQDYFITCGELGLHRLVRHVVKMSPAVQEESAAEIPDSAGETIESATA